MKSLFGGSAVIAATLFSSSFLFSAKPSVAETLLSSFQRSKQEVSQTNKQDSQQDSKTPTATSVTSTVAPPADSGEPRRASSATMAETVRPTGMVTIATEPAG